ncbi:unnamed protein product [Phaedon cochleariae]|uniref:Uncharacterized protein n=1 Tax=Phaedon cochleariae TaxID=80249 RepID=A0A9P0GVX7_PHACE|nr:unnamed protein product [Phaedon cochleariae]
MFASAGTALKLHSWADNQLQPLSIYKPKRLFGTASRLTDISWCHDNSYIAVLQEKNQPQILSSKDRTNLNLVHTIQTLKLASALSFKRHTKRTLALGNEEGEVVLYDTKNRNIARRVASLGNAINLLEFNSSDDRLAVVTERSLSTFSDLDGVNNFVKEAEYPELCSSVTFHPSCPQLLADGTSDGTVTLRDLEKGEVITTWHKHSASISGISFARHQKVMVTTGMDNKICVLDHSTAECLFRMNIHQPVTSSSLSQDGSFIAAGLEDGYVYIYDLREPLKPLVCDKTHNCPVNKVSFERCIPCRENSIPERTSATTLSEYGESRSEVSHSMGDVEKQECFEGKLKRDLLKSVKSHMGYLEGQLAEHCAKFQMFVNNEFEAIHGAMARWDVFNVADTCDGVQDAKTVKSTSNK